MRSNARLWSFMTPSAAGPARSARSFEVRLPPPSALRPNGPRQPELPALVAAMNREHSMLQMLNWATGDITGKVRHWKSASLAEQPRILDRADLLCVSGWMVGARPGSIPARPDSGDHPDRCPGDRRRPHDQRQLFLPVAVVAMGRSREHPRSV